SRFLVGCRAADRVEGIQGRSLPHARRSAARLRESEGLEHGRRIRLYDRAELVVRQAGTDDCRQPGFAAELCAGLADEGVAECAGADSTGAKSSVPRSISAVPMRPPSAVSSTTRMLRVF